MPRYYFDTRDGGATVNDDVGQDLPDLQAMRRAAIAVLPHMAADELPDEEFHVLTVRVRDERDAIVFHATFSLVTDRMD